MERESLLTGTKIMLGFSGNSMMLLPCGTQLLQRVPTEAVSCGVSAATFPSPEELSWAHAVQETFLFPSIPGV